MTETFTPSSFKNLSNAENLDFQDQKFYKSIKTKLNSLYRNPSEETIAKILSYTKKKR